MIISEYQRLHLRRKCNTQTRYCDTYPIYLLDSVYIHKQDTVYIFTQTRSIWQTRVLAESLQIWFTVLHALVLKKKKNGLTLNSKRNNIFSKYEYISLHIRYVYHKMHFYLVVFVGCMQKQASVWIQEQMTLTVWAGLFNESLKRLKNSNWFELVWWILYCMNSLNPCEWSLNQHLCHFLNCIINFSDAGHKMK